MSNRNIRVNELLKREISEILHTRYQKESVAITITKVDVAPDHRQARVYYSVILRSGDEYKAQAFLDRAAGQIRHELGRRIVLKNMPALAFHYDDTIEYEAHMNELLDSLDKCPEEDRS